MLKSIFSSLKKKKHDRLNLSVFFQFLYQNFLNFPKKIRRLFISNYFGTKNMLFHEKRHFQAVFAGQTAAVFSNISGGGLFHQNPFTVQKELKSATPRVVPQQTIIVIFKKSLNWSKILTGGPKFKHSLKICKVVKNLQNKDDPKFTECSKIHKMIQYFDKMVQNFKNGPKLTKKSPKIIK